jgi:hypothetical protein
MLDGNVFINSYLSWLREKITFTNVNDAIEITTPFLDSHNDHIQLYIIQKDNHIIITDDGYTISDLIMSGCDLSTTRRKDILRSILNGFGVKYDGKALYTEATERNYPQKKHALLQAVISVNDMFMLTQSRVSGVFLEDIELFFNQNEVRFTPAIQISGKSGFQHTYDFVIPASKQKPERLVRAINNPTKEKAESVLFSWSDTKNMRKNDSMMFVFLNDYDRNLRSGVTDAFLQYDVNPILWTKRDDSINVLAA